MRPVHCVHIWNDFAKRIYRKRDAHDGHAQAERRVAVAEIQPQALEVIVTDTSDYRLQAIRAALLSRSSSKELTCCGLVPITLIHALTVPSALICVILDFVTA